MILSDDISNNNNNTEEIGDLANDNDAHYSL